MFLEGSRVEFDTGWVGNPNTGVTVDDDQWHQIVVTFDASNDQLTIYVDDEALYDQSHDVNRFDETQELEGHSGFDIAATGLHVGWVSTTFYNNEFCQSMVIPFQFTHEFRDHTDYFSAVSESTIC